MTTPPPVRTHRQEREPASEAVTEVAPGILRMQLPIDIPGVRHVNTYGLVDDRGLAVIDPGFPDRQSREALQRRLASVGFRPKDIHTVLVTHSHPDHYGGAGYLQHDFGAEILAHGVFDLRRPGRRALRTGAPRGAREAATGASGTDPDLVEIPTIEDYVDDYDDDPLRATPRVAASIASPWGRTVWGGTRFPWRQVLTMRAKMALASVPRPTRRLVHRERVTLGGREWVTIHTPGHTADHLCLYDPEAGILLTGDHVLPTITPHVRGIPGSDSLRSYLQTLELVGALDGLRVGLPAHGHPFFDVPGRVAAIKSHHDKRVGLLCRAADALGPATVTALSHEVFPPRHWGVMAENDTYTHLEHLVHNGQAEEWRERGELLYRVSASG